MSAGKEVVKAPLQGHFDLFLAQQRGQKLQPCHHSHLFVGNGNGGTGFKKGFFNPSRSLCRQQKTSKNIQSVYS